MKALLNKLHARLGDFWWYSLMIFMAARAADGLNVFVGLWLVPKYVPPSELGAVQPLANFASFLALPAAVFASTFRQELSNLAVNHQFGKMKTLMRSVFIAAAIFLFLAIVISHFVLPHFLHRIRIAEGSLGMLIIAYSFISAIAPIFQNALQSLKKFKSTTVINLLGAPLRLMVMYLTMPLRALTGYFTGQASVPTFAIFSSLVSLRSELSVPARPYWTKDVIVRFARLFAIFAFASVAGGMATLVEITVLRQRLPELDSAGYYLATRFSEIASFLANALLFTIFPFAADLATKGKSTNPLIIRASIAIILTNILLASAFALAGEHLLRLLPHGQSYARYWWAIPWLIVITTMTSLIGIYTTAEAAAYRFRYLKVMIPVSILYTTLLLLITGFGYLKEFLPDVVCLFLDQHNIRSLSTMLIWMTGFCIVRLLVCVWDMFTKKEPHETF